MCRMNQRVRMWALPPSSFTSSPVISTERNQPPASASHLCDFTAGVRQEQAAVEAAASPAVIFVLDTCGSRWPCCADDRRRWGASVSWQLAIWTPWLFFVCLFLFLVVVFALFAGLRGKKVSFQSQHRVDELALETWLLMREVLRITRCKAWQ